VLVLAAVIALLFWSELIFSNLPSLADVSTPAGTLGWTISATRFYFIALSILDIVGGVGAVIAFVMFFRAADSNRLNLILIITTIALIVYGAVQFITAFFLPQNLQAVYWGIGIVYVLLGIGLRWLQSK